MEPEESLAGHPVALAVFVRVRSVLEALGPVDVRTTKSQVAFRRSRGFAYLWLPGRYLASPAVDVVLSIALGRHDPSPRFKEVAHPSPKHWMHHLELDDVRDVDDEVVAWLREAAERADQEGRSARHATTGATARGLDRAEPTAGRRASRPGAQRAGI